MRDLLNDLSEGLSHPDPIRRAQIQMKKPLPKRFYTKVTAEAVEGGYRLLLDGKPVRTPAGAALVLETEALARLVEAEWVAQAEVIDPSTMPITRLANTAIDGISSEREAVAAEIVKFAGNDMLCYRADQPEALVARQNSRWDPVIHRVEQDLGARFVLAEGVIHQEQPAETLQRFAQALQRYSTPMALASLHTVTTLTGSALLAYSFACGHLSADSCWDLAHLEEDWTIEHWGQDEEAEIRRSQRRAEMMAAASAFDALGIR